LVIFVIRLSVGSGLLFVRLFFRCIPGQGFQGVTDFTDSFRRKCV